MIYLIVLLSLLISMTLPWFYVAVLAALLATAKVYKLKELLQIFLGIWLTHSLVAVVLDLLAHGLVSQRLAGLFGLPFEFLIYLAAGLPPATLFVSTLWVVGAGRNLVKRRV